MSIPRLSALAFGLALLVGCGKSAPVAEDAPLGKAPPPRPREPWDELLQRLEANPNGAAPDDAERRKWNKMGLLAYSDGRAQAVYMAGYMVYTLSKGQSPREGFKEALDLYWLCRQLDPKFGRAHYGQGRIYYDLTIMDLAGRNRPTLPKEGMPVVRADDEAAPRFEAALKEFEKALELAPEMARDSDVETFLAMCRDKLVVYYANKGVALSEAGKPAEAVAWLEKALALPSAHVVFLQTSVAQALARTGRHDEALERLDLLLDKPPYNRDALLNRGLIRLDAKGIASPKAPGAQEALKADLASRNIRIRLGAAVLLASGTVADQLALATVLGDSPQLAKDLELVQPPKK